MTGIERVWEVAKINLLKDGKMGASKARTERIKIVLAYVKQR